MWLRPHRRTTNEKRGISGNFQQSQAGRGRELTKQNEKVGGKQDKMEPRSRGFMQAAFNGLGTLSNSHFVGPRGEG